VYGAGCTACSLPEVAGKQRFVLVVSHFSRFFSLPYRANHHTSIGSRAGRELLRRVGSQRAGGRRHAPLRSAPCDSRPLGMRNLPFRNHGVFCSAEDSPSANFGSGQRGRPREISLRLGHFCMGLCPAVMGA
jgi:hypothetical protein